MTLLQYAVIAILSYFVSYFGLKAFGLLDDWFIYKEAELRALSELSKMFEKNPDLLSRCDGPIKIEIIRKMSE